MIVAMVLALHMHYFIVKPGQAYPPRTINEFIIQKLNPLLVVDFRLIGAFLHVKRAVNSHARQL